MDGTVILWMLGIFGVLILLWILMTGIEEEQERRRHSPPRKRWRDFGTPRKVFTVVTILGGLAILIYTLANTF